VNYPDFLGHFNDGTIPTEVSNEYEKELPESLQVGGRSASQ